MVGITKGFEYQKMGSFETVLEVAYRNVCACVCVYVSVCVLHASNISRRIKTKVHSCWSNCRGWEADDCLFKFLLFPLDFEAWVSDASWIFNWRYQRMSLRISESGVQREPGTGCNIWSHESGNDIWSHDPRSDHPGRRANRKRVLRFESGGAFFCSFYLSNICC